MRGSSGLGALLPFLLLSVWRRGAAAAESACAAGVFRNGSSDFVLDVKDAVEAGAALLASLGVSAEGECEQRCCEDPRCNLALLEPGGHTCLLVDCVHQSRFACRFVKSSGYQSYVRESTFAKHLEGPGENLLPIAMAGRDVIIQPGGIVILNGTESLALHDAKITDYHWSLVSGSAEVKMEKTELEDQLKVTNLQPGSYEFQLTVTDSKGAKGMDRVRVLVLSPELSSSYCLDETKVGPCRAAFTRWRYNGLKGACETFTFGGCTPNKNNYLSEDVCVAACKGVAASTERSISPAGLKCGETCASDQLTCDGCCLDRSLECDDVKQCSDGADENNCDKLSETFSRLKNNSNDQVRCTEQPLTGPCRAYMTHWYYDPLEEKCLTFTYGGCRGNDNRFSSEARCRETCDGVTRSDVFSRGLFERYEKKTEEEAENLESKSGSVAVAVCLSVAILVLLAVLGYCYLRARKRKSSAQTTITTRPDVPLSEQDTLVYNSTTKPL